jgi:iron complex outermembrane receptor protein
MDESAAFVLPWNGVQLVGIRQFIAVGIAALASSLCAQGIARSQETAPQPPPDTAASAGNSTVGGLNADMKLEDLVKQDVVVPSLSTPVSTVERQASTVGRSPAAVFVITPEMIKRSGARTIPDVLRMAPGLDVARIDAHTWAISIRGFNQRYANKLLVQIDGRVIYNATFGGVYWNQQDVVLEDVERIEVIRGPQTTMWGSNAVNGVINIITKRACDTQGALVQSGGGAQDQQDFNTVRYGGNNGNGLYWRAWGQQFDRAPGWSDVGVDDAWHGQQGGFRMDYTPNKVDTLTVQGDLFNGFGGQRSIIPTVTPPFDAAANGEASFPTGNVLVRYGQVFDSDTSWQIQTYYDRYVQSVPQLFTESRDTYDVDLQYQFSPWDGHAFVTGANYRNSFNATQGTFDVTMDPANFTTQWGSVFAQDTMTLEEDRWYFTLGLRLEQNTFGGFQPEPTARLLFLPTERQSMWMAVSRAARNPTRSDTQITVNQHVGPPNVPVFGQYFGTDVEAENLVAYEVGYRAAPTDQFTWDIAGFFNDYNKVIGAGPVGPPVIVPPGLIIFPTPIQNTTQARTYGGELAVTYKFSERWRMYGAYTLFEIESREVNPGGSASPNNQLYLSSSWDLAHNWKLDLIGRYVDSLDILTATNGTIVVPSYFEMDMRIAWQATDSLEISFVAQNLLNDHHLEFIDAFGGLVGTEVQRSWYGMATWRF